MSSELLLAACVAAACQTTPPHYAIDGTLPSIRARLTQLETWGIAVEAQRPPSVETRAYRPDNGRFCSVFGDFDIQRHTRTLWSDFSTVPLTHWIPLLARYVRQCALSSGSAKRAGFLLDLLYWNRLEDLTGENSARFTMVRDGFYEIHILRLVESALERQARFETGAFEPPSRGAGPGDFLDAMPMRRLTYLRAVPELFVALAPEARRGFSRMLELVDFREGHLTPFGSSLLSILENEKDLAMLQNVYDYLLWVRERPELLQVPHGGFHALMQISSGDPVRVMRVFGVLGALLYLPLQELAPALALRGKLTEKGARAMYQGAMAYYVMNQADELSARVSPWGERTFHFFYPDEYETTNWKHYHYYGNAYLGCETARLGIPEIATAAAARLLAVAYEGATLSLVMVARHTLNVEPRAAAIVEAGEDVQINVDGAIYGARICRSAGLRNANHSGSPPRKP